MAHPLDPVIKRMRELSKYEAAGFLTSGPRPDFDSRVINPLDERDYFPPETNPMPEPTTTKPKKQSSFVAILCDLEVGSSAVRNHSPHPIMTLAQLAEELSEMKAMISNNVRPSVRIATEKTGHTFAVETSQTITATGRVYVQVIVTRTA